MPQLTLDYLDQLDRQFAEGAAKRGGPASYVRDRTDSDATARRHLGSGGGGG
jgi:hypothetical protein